MASRDNNGVKSQLMMDRGTDALRCHLHENCQRMEIRQTRRGWCQELLFGCDARTEFKYYVNGSRQQVAHSIENSNCCVRCCCPGIHPFTMAVEELNTRANLITLERPLRCHPASCKCCCYQMGIVHSGSTPIGSIRETCYICNPEFHVYDSSGQGLYRLHPPTCCCGTCINCCAEGNPCCGRGCCRVPFHIFPYHQYNTDNAAYIGKIVKKRKSFLDEFFTDAEAYEVEFPKQATAEQKGVIMGAAILLNAMFFEHKHNDGDAGGA